MDNPESSNSELVPEGIDSSGDMLYNTEQVKEVARVDMDFFGGLVLPEVLTLQFPNFYVWLWGILTGTLSKTRDFSKFALGLPRGHAKTMVIKLLIVYAILFTKKKYILVIGANLAKAQAIVADIADMLDSSNIQAVFGNWRYQIEQDTHSLKKFNFNGRPVILEAAGQGTAIRGAQQKNSRPDMIVLDDAQTKECAESITESTSFQSWLVGTVLKSKSPWGCTFIYIGNMYKDIELVQGTGIYTCMLRNLQKSTEWTSFIIGAILADGTSLWEELYPLEDLLKDFNADLQLGQQDIFYAEVLNDPKTSTSYHIDTSKFRPRDFNSGDLHQGNYIVIDPATSKRTPDQIVIGYFEIYDNTPNFVEFLSGKFTSPETVYKAIELAVQKQCTCIVVESNAYQYALCQWFEFVLKQLQISGISVIPLYSRSNKNSKILKGFQTVMKGELTLSSKVYNSYVAQATDFDPRVINNVDDLLDVACMAEIPPLEHRQFMAIQGDLANGTDSQYLALQHQRSYPDELEYSNGTNF